MEIAKKTLFERMQTKELSVEQIQKWYDKNVDREDLDLGDDIACMIFAAGALQAIDKVNIIK